MLLMTGFILILLLAYIIIPIIINYLVYKSSFLRRLGAIVIAYGIGLLLGNIGLFPRAGETMVQLVNHKEMVLTDSLIGKLYPGETTLTAQDITVNKKLVAKMHDEGLLSDDDVRYFNIYKLQDTLALPLSLLFRCCCFH